MDRRSFLGWLAAIPALLGVAALPEANAGPEALAAETAPAALLVFDEAHAEFGVTAAEETIFPFFWDAEVVSGILAVPLLDALIAEESVLGSSLPRRRGDHGRRPHRF